jgi:hypothetical protein
MWSLSFLESVGAIEARKYILNLIIQHYQRIIPLKLTQLRTLKSELEEKQKKTTQIEELNDITKLRHIAFDYVSIFCDNVNRLFEEYSLKNAERFGQTMKEELEASGTLFKQRLVTLFVFVYIKRDCVFESGIETDFRT